MARRGSTCARCRGAKAGAHGRIRGSAGGGRRHARLTDAAHDPIGDHISVESENQENHKRPAVRLEERQRGRIAETENDRGFEDNLDQ